MSLIATITGSYPPLYEDDDSSKPILVEESIQRAVADQIAAGVDLLVDGQVSADIVTLFAPNVSGYDTQYRPYRIIRPIVPLDASMTASELKLAMAFAKEQGSTKPFKAHITGPSTIAWSSQVDKNDPDRPYQDYYDKRLVVDIAHALAQEARLLRLETGVKTIQIDEPIFWRGANLDVGIEAVNLIANEIEEPLLHVCGDIRPFFGKLLDAKVKVLCVEGEQLRKVSDTIDKKLLDKRGIKIGFGCVAVNNNEVESIREIQADIRWAIDFFGLENIWGITPDCGFRRRPRNIALEKMTRMVQVKRLFA